MYIQKQVVWCKVITCIYINMYYIVCVCVYSETSCLQGILRRTERAMVRKMCGVKLADKKNTKELMERLGLKETIVEVIKRSSLRWMGHVLRRDKDEPVKRVWNLEIAGKRERGRPKMTWKDMVKKESRKIGMDERDAQDRKKWRTGIATWKE